MSINKVLKLLINNEIKRKVKVWCTQQKSKLSHLGIDGFVNIVSQVKLELYMTVNVEKDTREFAKSAEKENILINLVNQH